MLSSTFLSFGALRSPVQFPHSVPYFCIFLFASASGLMTKRPRNVSRGLHELLTVPQVRVCMSGFWLLVGIDSISDRIDSKCKRGSSLACGFGGWLLSIASGTLMSIIRR
ncbi:hypothetical protein DER45DRAFT_552052 [Fusarium avenaceum]|nr:hypothetical protein DER45DRAFT_552052 [Fusarium avenaceum]